MSSPVPPEPTPRPAEAEQALAASERRLVAQSAALTQLMARYADSPGALDEQIRGIVAVTARALGADRVSMWSIDRPGDRIVCTDLYERAADRHTSGLLLPRANAPRYFHALDSERVIAAHDARFDPRTSEFRESYLVQNEIRSMLDVPLRRNGVTVGVLCVENFVLRGWTLDEQHFAIAIAHLIGAALADEERRAAVTRLAESESRARLLIDTAHDAFVGIDSSGVIVSWNAQAEQTFGWTRDEALGRSLVETIIPPGFRDAHARGMDRFHQTGEAPVVNQRLELVALHRSGSEFPVEITITWPTRVESGGYFFGAFLRDISDRRERDDQLRLAKESAEAATRAKSEFLANMSHELRTPLNGVLGYAQLLQRDRSLNASQREALEAIAKGGAHLLDLINDVLDLSRIEAGRLDIEAAITDLAQMAIDLKYLVAEAARRKGLLLGMAIAPDTPRRVVLDGRHLRQVLLNLLNNAIKFTPQGEVHLSIAKASEDRLLFEVSDTGVGIEPGDLAAIFEAFTQTKSGAAAGGTGLGLTISQHLIAKMGGELRVQSQPGLGSRFYFDLPLESAGASDSGATDADLAAPPLDARLAEGEDVAALVADDSTVNRRILAALLESAGVRVITAAGGLEAVALARKHRPSVVFMDLKMADLDGFEATRRLQADPATAEIPVIAVTASAFGDTRTAALNAGCVDYLPKPVRAGALFAALQKHLGVRFVSSQPVEPEPPTVTSGSARAGVAARLRDAVELGAITDLEALAQELVNDGGDPALGRQVAALVQSFDFEGLRALAAALGSGEPSGR